MAHLPRWQIESWIRLAAVAWFCGTAHSPAAPQPPELDPLGKELVTAVQQGNVNQTAALLARWKTTSASWPLGPDKQPLLFVAIEGREKSHPDIIELLFSKGATVEMRGEQAMTAAALGRRERLPRAHHADSAAPSAAGGDR